MTRMTSFLRLFVDKVSNFHLCVLHIALHCVWVRLVASGTEPREIENEQALLVPHAAMPRSCPYVLFSYYSHICVFCSFIALYSPLMFLQQRLLESLIRVRNEVHCFILSYLSLYDIMTHSHFDTWHHNKISKARRANNMTRDSKSVNLTHFRRLSICNLFTKHISFTWQPQKSL
jgi:hypothetical protein